MSVHGCEAQLRDLLARWALGSGAGAGSSCSAPAGGFDFQMLSSMQKTHPTLVARLVDTYLVYAPKAMVQLLAAALAGNSNQAMTTVHSLKSSSANIGAVHLAEQCRELEVRLKTAAAWDAARDGQAVVEIESTFQVVAAALSALQRELRLSASVSRATV